MNGAPIRTVAVPGGGELAFPAKVKVVKVVRAEYVPQVVLVTVAGVYVYRRSAKLRPWSD